MRAFLAACLLLPALAACQSSGTVYTPPEVQAIQNERVVPLDFESAWNGVVKGMSRGFMTIRAVERDPANRVVVAFFEVPDPKPFAACGTFRHTYDDSLGTRPATEDPLRSGSVRRWRDSAMGVQRLDRVYRQDIRLNGTTNVYVAPITAKQTLVNVKINYRLSWHHRAVNEDGDEIENEVRTVEFATLYPGTGTPRCVSLGTLENQILDLADQQGARLEQPCLVKGIVAGDRRFYSAPGSRGYDAYIVNEAAGGRWFCTEQDAEASGFGRQR